MIVMYITEEVKWSASVGIRK